MEPAHRLYLQVFVYWLLGLLLVLNTAHAAPFVEQWTVIKDSFFPAVTVKDADAAISIHAPIQAENAAMVPFSFKIALPEDRIQSVHLFTDANPMLHTATFNLPQAPQRFHLSTRIRLEKNSIVRVIVQTVSGNYLMQTAAIKTPGGGCGGGAMTNEAKLRAEAGKMKVKFLSQAKDGTQPFVLMIKHPMRTGFERTFQGYYAKAWFMEKLKITADHQRILDAKLGPGISADPYFNFHGLLPTRSAVTVTATDNEGKVFEVR